MIQTKTNLWFPNKNYYVVSAHCSNMLSNVQSQPNVFKPVMFDVVDDFKPPSHRVRGDGNRRTL